MRIALIGLAPLQSLGLREVIREKYPAAEVLIFDCDNVSAPDGWPEADKYIVSSAAMAAFARHLMPRLSAVLLLTSSRPLTDGRNSLPCLSPLATEQEISRTLGSFINGQIAVVHHPHHLAGKPEKVDDLRLTAREVDVLRETVMGLSVKEIAVKLGISVNTVLTHRKNLAEKTGMHSAPALVYYAMKHRLV